MRKICKSNKSILDRFYCLIYAALDSIGIGFAVRFDHMLPNTQDNRAAVFVILIKALGLIKHFKGSLQALAG